jgi:hypothetical protein
MQLQNSKVSGDDFTDLLSPDEAVRLIPEKFKISRSTLMRLAKAGKIRSYQPVPRGRRFFRREDILGLLEPQGGAENDAGSEGCLIVRCLVWKESDRGSGLRSNLRIANDVV